MQKKQPYAQTSRRERLDNAINAGSMADIAFLLLIFFLVTTTIVTDKGIMVKLPPISDQPAAPLSESRVINIKLNAEGALLFEGHSLEIAELKQSIKTYILNEEQLPNRPSSPDKAVISLQNDRSTSYEKYLSVYDELKAAYRELWEERAQAFYQSPFESLDIQEQKAIKTLLPQVISEADPTDYAIE